MLSPPVLCRRASERWGQEPLGVTARSMWGCDREPVAEVSLFSSVFIPSESLQIFGYRGQCKDPLGQQTAQPGLVSPRGQRMLRPAWGRSLLSPLRHPGHSSLPAPDPRGTGFSSLHCIFGLLCAIGKGTGQVLWQYR